jgi:hypothetical protein
MCQWPAWRAGTALHGHPATHVDPKGVDVGVG